MKPFKLNVLASVLATIAFVLPGVANTAVYKYIDEDGNVAFGDKPVDGSEKINLQVIRPSNNNSPADDEDSDNSEERSSSDRSNSDRDVDDGAFNGDELEEGESEAVDYQSLVLLTPRPGKIVNERSGSVQVIFLPTPSLGPDDKLVITVDGKDVSNGRDANLALQNLPRGSHTVSGRILTADGEVAIATNPITFSVGSSSALALGDN